MARKPSAPPSPDAVQTHELWLQRDGKPTRKLSEVHCDRRDLTILLKAINKRLATSPSIAAKVVARSVEDYSALERARKTRPSTNEEVALALDRLLATNDPSSENLAKLSKADADVVPWIHCIDAMAAECRRVSKNLNDDDLLALLLETPATPPYLAFSRLTGTFVEAANLRDRPVNAEPRETPAVDDATINRAAERAAAKTVEAMEARVDTGIGGTDTDWKNVRGQLLAKLERGEPYTSVRKLARAFGCSDATIRKAIDRSPSLRGWKDQSKRPKAAPKAMGLGAKVIDNARQTTEPAADDFLSDDEVDTTFARLIEQAKPDERTKLNALDDAGRRALAAAYQSHNLDDEPSPLKPDNPGERPRKVKQHKRA